MVLGQTWGEFRGHFGGNLREFGWEKLSSTLKNAFLHQTSSTFHRTLLKIIETHICSIKQIHNNLLNNSGRSLEAGYDSGRKADDRQAIGAQEVFRFPLQSGAKPWANLNRDSCVVTGWCMARKRLWPTMK